MTRFTNGPAQGVVLGLTRVPIYLRVVRDGRGKWDALNNLDDRIGFDETPFAYKLASNDGRVHVNSRDAKTGRRTGGCFAMATYEVIASQPDDAIMRDNTKWAEWCHATHDQAKEAAP